MFASTRIRATIATSKNPIVPRKPIPIHLRVREPPTRPAGRLMVAVCAVGGPKLVVCCILYTGRRLRWDLNSFEQLGLPGR